MGAVIPSEWWPVVSPLRARLPPLCAGGCVTSPLSRRRTGLGRSHPCAPACAQPCSRVRRLRLSPGKSPLARVGGPSPADGGGRCPVPRTSGLPRAEAARWWRGVSIPSRRAIARSAYEPTPLGRSILQPPAAACAWAEEHWDELLDARESYDDATRLDHAGRPAHVAARPGKQNDSENDHGGLRSRMRPPSPRAPPAAAGMPPGPEPPVGSAPVRARDRRGIWPGKSGIRAGPLRSFEFRYSVACAAKGQARVSGYA